MNIKALLLASVGVAAISFNASAADLALKAVPARPAYVAPFSWTGWYIGGFAGASFSNHKSTASPDGEGSFFDAPGSFFGPPTETRGLVVQGLAGATIGYNLQVNGNIVLGLEADAAWLSKAQSHSTTSTSTYSFNGGCGQGFQTGSIKNQYGATSIGTVRARFGVAFDRTMVFATGGLAVGRVKSSTEAAYSYAETYGNNSANGSASWSGSSSKTKYGYALGGGFEHALTNHVIFKLDAMYYNLGKVTTRATGSGCTASRCNSTCNTGPGTAQSYKSTHTVDGVMTRVGLNYKF